MSLILHVDHIDGNYLDCRPRNVRFMCPNCHSQTATWAGGNKLIYRYRVPPALGSRIRVDKVLTLFDRLDEQSAS